MTKKIIFVALASLLSLSAQAKDLTVNADTISYTNGKISKLFLPKVLGENGDSYLIAVEDPTLNDADFELGKKICQAFGLNSVESIEAEANYELYDAGSIAEISKSNKIKVVENSRTFITRLECK